MKMLVLISTLLSVVGLMSVCKSRMTNETVIDSMPPTEVAAIQDECLFKDVEITAAEFDSSHIEADPKQGH